MKKTLYTLTYLDSDYVLKDKKLYDDPAILIKHLEDSCFVFDREDDEGIEYIRQEDIFYEYAKIMKLTYEETTPCN